MVLLSLLFLLGGKAHWFGLICIVPLLTILLGRCPAYRLFGLDTCPVWRPD